jgi:hypothetical protein
MMLSERQKSTQSILLVFYILCKNEIYIQNLCSDEMLFYASDSLFLFFSLTIL